MEFVDYQNIHEMVRQTVDQYPEKMAYRWILDGEETVSVSWKEFYAQLKKVAKSLMALDVKKEDKINIISNTCFRWVLTDLAAVSIGATGVGIYQSNLPKDCKYIINHSDAVIIFAEDEIQLKKILEIRNEIPNIRKVVLFRGDYSGDDWVIRFDEFLNLGNEISDEAFKQISQVATPDDNAAIVYTSGTTGVPKGVVLTHDNILFTAQSVFLSSPIKKGEEKTFLFLPMAHVFARTAVLTAVHTGTGTTFARSLDTIVDDLKVAAPDWYVSVPRIYEKVYSKVQAGAETKGGVALKIFRWACDVGMRVSEAKLAKKNVPVLTALKYKVAEKLVFSKLHEAFGGNLKWCISGAAPINPDIAKFFHAAGILILEGLGMTENTSFTNVNRYNDYRFGWVGQPGVGVEQKIAADGEILFRGRNVMKEYYKMPEETAKTIDEDGWLYTGDLGEIDSENFLRITGRKKELIITAGGKNIAPAAIEGVIATSKYVNQVFVIGDRRKYLTAIITLDPDTVKEYADIHQITYDGIDDLINNDKIIELINSEVAEKNKEFASFETIKKVTLVPEFTIENGLITPTMKLKKSLVADHYKKEIDAMYGK